VSSADIKAGNSADSLYDTHPSRSEPVSYTTLSWSTLSISGGKFLTVGASFAIGNKDLAPALKSSEARAYELQISDASNMAVLFYSSHDRRAWLLDGASALVHLARTWLQSGAARLKNPELMHQLQYIHGSGGQSAAIDTLMANRELAIFADTETKLEESLSSSSTADSDTATSDSGYATASGSRSVLPSLVKKESKRVTSRWTYKALVYDLWRSLEAMKAKLDQLKRHGPEVRLRMPTMRPHLIGWDAVDLLSNRFPLEPRYVRLKAESKSWVDYAAEISAVPLMAESFGELIRPSEGVQVCKSMATLPTGRDVLATPVSVLLLSARRFLRWEESIRHSSVRISDHTFLNGVDTASWRCTCKQGHQCRAVSELGSKPKKSDTRMLGAPSQTVFERYPRGAVIIGEASQRSWQWSSRTRRVPSVDLDEPPPSIDVRELAAWVSFDRDVNSNTVGQQRGAEEDEDDSKSQESVYFSCGESYS